MADSISRNNRIDFLKGICIPLPHQGMRERGSKAVDKSCHGRWAQGFRLPHQAGIPFHGTFQEVSCPRHPHLQH